MDMYLEKIRNKIKENVTMDSNGCWNWTMFIDKRFGYGAIAFKGRPKRVHRVSAHVFSGFDLQSKLMVLHKCDNRACCNPEHLFYGTQLDNMRDCSKKGRMWDRSGQKNPRAKLSLKDTVDILQLLKDGDKSQREIGLLYDVPQATISKIKLGLHWSTRQT
jgi:hypothetical protein